MTDQTIPADKVREIIARWRDGVSDRGGLILDDLKALLPAPPLPTLADMSPDERAACQWFQADVETWGRAVIIVPNVSGRRAMTLNRRGHVAYEDHASVTPRPDLPRLEWPGDTPAPAPAPALPDGWKLADHEKYGRVVVTNPTPDTDGHVYFVAPAASFLGNDWHLCKHDELTYTDTDQEADQ